MISKHYFEKNFTQQAGKDLQKWIDAKLGVTPPAADDIMFETSFDGTVEVKYLASGHELIGIDSKENNFPYDIIGKPYRVGEGSSPDFFNYVLGSMNMSNPSSFEPYIKTSIKKGLTIPNTSTKTALFQEFITNRNGLSTRNQYNMRTQEPVGGDAVHRFDQGYIKWKQKIKLTNNKTQNWMLPWEFKQSGDNNGRFGIYIYDADTASPYWYIQSQKLNSSIPGQTYWHDEDRTVPVPLDTWFDMEMFWVGSGDDAIGKVQFAVNGVLVFDKKGRTKEPNSDDNPYYLGIWKIYGHSAQSHITDVVWAKEPIAGSILTGSK